MLSTEIDLADALMSIQEMTPSDWEYVSKMCMQVLNQSGSSNVPSSSPSDSDSSTEDLSIFGSSSSPYPLKESMIPNIPSTTSASDAAAIYSSFTASLTDISTTNCCPSFYPDVPVNAMRPSISILLASIASKDEDTPATDSEASSASPTPSLTDTPTTTSEDTSPSPVPSTPPQIPMDVPWRQTSISSQPSPVSTATKRSYYREHTYTSPPADPDRPVGNRYYQPTQSTTVLAQPNFTGNTSSSYEMVTSIRQPPMQDCRFVPYSAKDRPPSLASRVLTSSSSFSFADQTFSPKPYIPSKCPIPTPSKPEKQSLHGYSKVFCRKGKYDQLVFKLGINDPALYYGWKADYVTCYLPGCNQTAIKNTRAEVSKHVKAFHLCAQNPQYVVRDCCPFASASERFIKVDMVYGHFQTEKHSFVHNSHQYSCGHCGELAARPDQLDNHFFECRALWDYVQSLKSTGAQASFYPRAF